VKDTYLRPQRNGYVGTPEGCDLARGANELEPEEGGTCRERKRVSPSEGHSPLEAAEGCVATQEKSLQGAPRYGKKVAEGTHEGRRGRDTLGHRKKVNKQGTHCLETAGGRGQGIERRKLSNGTHEGGTLGDLWMSANRRAVCTNSVWWRDLQYTTRDHTLKVLNP